MVRAVLVLTALAIAAGVLLTVVGWRHPPAPVYQCRRCGRVFRRRSHRGFPARCPACSSPRWNEP